MNDEKSTQTNNKKLAWIFGAISVVLLVAIIIALALLLPKNEGATSGAMSGQSEGNAATPIKPDSASANETPSPAKHPSPTKTQTPAPPPPKESSPYIAELNGYQENHGIVLTPSGDLYVVGDVAPLFGLSSSPAFQQVLADSGPFTSLHGDFQGTAVTADGKVFRWGQELAEDAKPVGDEKVRELPGITDAIDAQILYTSEFGSDVLVLRGDGTVTGHKHGEVFGPENVKNFDVTNRYAQTYVTKDGKAFLGALGEVFPVEGVADATDSCASSSVGVFLDKSGDVHMSECVDEMGGCQPGAAEITFENASAISCNKSVSTAQGMPVSGAILNQDNSATFYWNEYVSRAVGEPGFPASGLSTYELLLPGQIDWITGSSATTAAGDVFWWSSMQQPPNDTVAPSRVETPW